MSVYDDIPAAFPLDVPVKTLPARFVLRADAADKVVTTLLALFWGLGLAAVLYATADPFAPWDDTSTSFVRIAAAVALPLYLVLAFRVWPLPLIGAVFRRVSVEIADGAVSVEERGLLGTKSWSAPLSEFEGITRANWGTRLVGQNKIAIAAIVLSHRDETRSIPLVIGGALDVKPAWVERKARQLGVKALDGVRDSGPHDPIPPGTLVVNRWQALKVRGVYWVFGALGLTGLVTLPLSLASGGEPALAILALVAAAVGFAMHIFAACYVVGMRREAEGLVIETASVLSRPRHVRVSDVSAPRYREGRLEGGRQTVHAPWVSIKVAGARLPYIIDMQSDYVDEAGLLALGR